VETPYLGELEELTLLALLRKSGPASGADIREELSARAERRVSPSTAYLTLMRLEEKGLCSSWKGEHEPIPGGKARRWFRISSEGIDLLQRCRDLRARMWEEFDELAERSLADLGA